MPYNLYSPMHRQSIEGHQSEPIQTTEMQVTQSELCEEVCKYYRRLRADELPSLTHQIPAEFARIQRQIIQVVELRKNMQKVLELEALQAEHFPTVQRLVELSKKQERSIAQMAAHLKEVDSGNIEVFLQSLLKQRAERTKNESEIIEKGHQLVMQLKDFKRTFNININQIQPPPQQWSLFQGEQAQKWEHEQHFEELMRWQQRRWDLARFVYSVKLKQLNLRDQLLEERERIQIDFEKANHELIDTLLREKERDKNLRKKDNQKFGEIIKQRDQIDLENQNLSHSEKSLLPHLQSQLLKMKGKLREQEQRHELEKQKMHKKNEQIVKELQQAQHLIDQSKSKQANFLQRESDFKSKINELQQQLQQFGESRKTSETSLKASQAETQLQLQKLRTKVKQLQHLNAQLQTKSQQLQSQCSELILKSSQLSQIKTELSQKLDKSSKRVKLLQTGLQEMKVNLMKKEGQMNSLQQFAKTLQEQCAINQNKINDFQRQLAQHRKYAKDYQEKTTNLENELTQNFILHNQERTNLLMQVDQREKTIEQLRNQVEEERKAKMGSISISDQQLSPSLLEKIKEQVRAQLIRSEKMKLQLIDSFVGRIQDLV